MFAICLRHRRFRLAGTELSRQLLHKKLLGWASRFLDPLSGDANALSLLDGVNRPHKSIRLLIALVLELEAALCAKSSDIHPTSDRGFGGGCVMGISDLVTNGAGLWHCPLC